MLGFIVGGGIGNDGENFSVEIELRGINLKVRSQTW